MQGWGGLGILLGRSILPTPNTISLLCFVVLCCVFPASGRTNGGLSPPEAAPASRADTSRRALDCSGLLRVSVPTSPLTFARLDKHSPNAYSPDRGFCLSGLCRLRGQFQAKSPNTSVRKVGDGDPAAPALNPISLVPRDQGRSMPSRQGAPGRVSDPRPGLHPERKREVLPCSLRGLRSRQPAPWGSLGARPAWGSKAGAGPFGPLLGGRRRWLCALPSSLSRRSPGLFSPHLPSAPRRRWRRGGGGSARPVPHYHHTRGDYSPHSRLPHSPRQSSRGAAHAAEHRRAHSAHYRNRSSAQPASPRNFQRPPRNFSQLHHGCPPPPPLWLPPSLPPTPNPRNKPRLENAPIPSPPPPIPRSPSHTRG
uniref:Uncharacterized protein n=1 Tax=Mustela putorius furo TaxID=9669 RepID=M3Z5C6_MUSPF